MQGEGTHRFFAMLSGEVPIEVEYQSPSFPSTSGDKPSTPPRPPIRPLPRCGCRLGWYATKRRCCSLSPRVVRMELRVAREVMARKGGAAEGEVPISGEGQASKGESEREYERERGTRDPRVQSTSAPLSSRHERRPHASVTFPYAKRPHRRPLPPPKPPAKPPSLFIENSKDPPSVSPISTR